MVISYHLMESRHHDHARLLTNRYMDPQTGQMRPPYTDLCRPPGTDTSAYHRYIPSMPLSTGSGFPFLGGMYTGNLPAPPASPFRTPSTPGVNNMRQFWPPTPPPDGGYGRLALNTNLFPLFGASPDSGAFLTQGLVSRLGSTTHLSPLIDHKEHSFFSHGIGLGTPLTPTGHVTSPSTFPHLIPSLERHPVYGGHMTLGNKELEDLQHEADDNRLMKTHLDCLMKHDIPSSRPKSKLEGKNCCDKIVDDCCKLSQSCISGDSVKSHSEMQNTSNKKQLTHKVQPCKIEVSHSPAIKPDLLSPPIDSPKSDVPSPNRSFRKASNSPFGAECAPVPVTRPAYEEKSQTRCSQCCANIKDIDAATKLSASEMKENPAPVITQPTSNSVIPQTSHMPVLSSVSNPVSATVNIVSSSQQSHQTSVNAEAKLSYESESSCSANISDKSNTIEEEDDDGDNVNNNNNLESSLCKSSVTSKHVTAAVIPTAPKRDIHPEMTEQKSLCVKVELESSPNNPSNSISGTFTNRTSNKTLSTSCKVKDMIKNVCSAKQMQQNSLLKHSENFEPTKTPPESPKAISSSASVITLTTIVSKSPSKNTFKMQYMPLDKCSSPLKEEIPVMKNESANSRLDCEFSQKTNPKWTKATVSPFTWQGNNNPQDDQAINLTVSKKVVKPEPNDTVSPSDNLKSLETSNSNVIGVCHPNPITMNKSKNSPTVSSVNNFASISVLNPEVHILHRASKTSFPPAPLKSTGIHRSLKTERLMTKRGKINEMDKLNHASRTTLATLAPKLSKNVNFGKDLQSSHTISASSSVSSTSIVFPATVNPCIPVGIAIAQQRQDSSTATSIGKSQSSVSSSAPSALSATSHLTTNHVAADIQTQEILRDQKNQDLPLSNNAAPVDASLLVAQGPTIVSRQWESEALTRTAALPSSWVAHGSIVAPAVWLGQGTYAAPAPPAANTVPNVAMNSIESSPISLPPGGYQLARDSITGHLLLIPTANIELMDRPSVWPAFNSAAGNLPLQQLVTQQVLPQSETLKTADPVDTNCNITACDIASNTAVKTEEKMEELSGQVPSVPLAAGQTYAFTTFPTQCDPASFSYVLQSSTVMHLAHTQTTASIQTESGRRSQATSPLHCATPSPPPPNICDEESENESDMECCENNQQQALSHNHSVTTAIQVDMDSQTNSEEDEDEDGKITIVKSDNLKVEMSDSANQTEYVPSESPKSEPEAEDVEIGKLIVKEEIEINSEISSVVKEDSVAADPGLEIVTSETELAPSLPVESKPVMDFIDHHGLNLLVDSIEEFASREQEETEPGKIEENLGNEDSNLKSESESSVPKSPQNQKFTQTVPHKSFPSNFKTLDTTVTDGLGLLCALVEQRFFEEALNDDCKTEEPKTDDKKYFDSSSSSDSSPSQREVSEMEMRLQIEELQKKYKQKQRELELLRKSKGKENNEEDLSDSEVLQSLKISSNSSSNESESNKKSEEETNSNKTSILEQNASSMKPIHVSTKVSHSRNSDTSGSCSSHLHENEKKTSSEPTFEKSDKGKTPFFDEQAWFVRRSERIFLSDTRSTASTSCIKKGNSSSPKGSFDTNKEKKEQSLKLKNQKTFEETSVKKNRNKPLKPKKRLISSDSDSSEEEKFSESESCTSENVPLSSLIEHSSSNKASVLERQKRLSTDSEYSSGQSDDLPLSVLLEQKIPEVKSCILKPEDLQENVRLLVLDEGLFYAGYITKSEDPDMYGILIDGDRAARPHTFSKEEIFNAAVLEVKPTHKLQLPEGSRICAFWSQQYRCLYPGTVTKASSPLTDPSLLYVEFDDGDRGRIPLADIRMLPSDFPIVSLEPNPFMILGKRRSRTQNQNNINGNSEMIPNPCKNERDKMEHKKQKIPKKNVADGKEKLKTKSAARRSRSSSKSSVNGPSELKPLNSKNKKEEKRKAESKSKDANVKNSDSILKPKKHKKHKEDHHKHHHHHHKHHHHKKHKAECSHSSSETVISSNKNRSLSKDSPSSSNTNASDTFVLENSKSDLTVKIKKSPSPHTNHEDNARVTQVSTSSSDEDEEPPAKKQKKSKLVSPSKRKDRVPSIEKSKIAAFLPDRQLWRWSGKSFRRPGAKGKAKKEFYRSIQRGKETIKVGDCAVFLSTGRPHLPYIGRIETMWESWGGKMDVKVKWFYHPEETKSGKKLSQLKGALFQSPHFDENDVQTISHKCEVLPWSEYQQTEKVEDNNDTYFLAGTYDPIMGTLILEPDVPNICEP